MENKTIDRIGDACVGCGLCKAICPKECISMVRNKEGFLVPSINSSLCIECGLCYRSCFARQEDDLLYYDIERKYFCGIASDEKMLKESSSGGAFGILSEYVLEQGGFVCGCVYDDHMEAVHIVTNQSHTVKKMFGSKYVQSRCYHCFAEIADKLKKDTPILFSGTACQIAALRTYLRRDYDNLICIEILCHGVPSPALFEKYVKYLEKRLHGKIVDIQFRNKDKHGWGSEHRTCVVYEKNGSIRRYRPTLPAYFSSFFYGLNLRESCYRCKFARPERVADITLGDFWGSWTKYGRRFEKGISVLGVNSPKGEEIMLRLTDKFSFFEPLTQQEAFSSNGNFEYSVKRPKERSEFYQGSTERGYRGLWKKTYFTRTYKRKTLSSIYGAFIPVSIRYKIQHIRKSLKK